MSFLLPKRASTRSKSRTGQQPTTPGRRLLLVTAPCRRESRFIGPRGWFLAAVVAALAGTPKTAAAYSTNTVVSDPCHEIMTFRALDAAREKLGDAGMIEATESERALIEDVPFRVPEEHKNLAAVTLVMGNRHNDFKGKQPDDLDQLAQIHGNPDNQEEHCLRTPSQDGVEGSKQALNDCRSYILDHIELAFEGLDEAGNVDPDARTEIDLALDLRGGVKAKLPTFYLEMGHALHAIQDGFSHTYRTEDHRRVVSVLNYVDLVNDEQHTAEDGPAHLTSLDACTQLDELRSNRLDVAMRASEEFLLAALDPSLTPDERRFEVMILLDRYFTHVDECSADDNWCNAPEEQYQKAASGCSVKGATGHGMPAPGGLVASMSLLSLFWLRRRNERRTRRISVRANDDTNHKRFVRSGLWGTMFLGATTMLPSRAEAAEPVALETEGETADAATAPPEPTEDVNPWGVALNLSGAIENPGLAAALGLRYRVSEHFLVGLDGEYNPWFAQSSGQLRPGVASVYATFILRFPMSFERVNLRSTLQLGASRMMFDLYGVPEGSIGPYVGVNLLGLDYELGKQVYLTLDPAHIAIPIPQISGAPYANPQYRVTFGLQWGG